MILHLHRAGHSTYTRQKTSRHFLPCDLEVDAACRRRSPACRHHRRQARGRSELGAGLLQRAARAAQHGRSAARHFLRAGLGRFGRGDAGRLRRHPCRADASASDLSRRRHRAAVRRRHDRPSDGHRGGRHCESRRARSHGARAQRRSRHLERRPADPGGRRASLHAAARQRSIPGARSRSTMRAPTRRISFPLRLLLLEEQQRMRLTQGTFSFLPDLTDAQIAAQIEYCLQQGWAMSVEYTDDPHPRNTYWEMFGMPDVRPEGRSRHHAGSECVPTHVPESLRESERVRCDARRRIACGCPSSSIARRRSRGSAWCAKKAGPQVRTLRYATQGRRASAELQRCEHIGGGCDELVLKQSATSVRSRGGVCASRTWLRCSTSSTPSWSGSRR